jgi:hypothetical protein
MIQSNYTVHIVEPSNGTNGWLTQAQELEIQDRVFSKKIFLAVNDSVDNWREITEEEYAAYQVELEAYNNQMSTDELLEQLEENINDLEEFNKSI